MGATVIEQKYEALTREEIQKGQALFSSLRMFYMRYIATDLLQPMKQWSELDTARKLIFCDTAKAVRYL